jgi:hypothetical protein
MGLGRLLFGGPPIKPAELTGGVTDALRAVLPLVFLNACDGGEVAWASVWIVHCHCGAFVGPQWPGPV